MEFPDCANQVNYNGDDGDGNDDDKDDDNNRDDDKDDDNNGDNDDKNRDNDDNGWNSRIAWTRSNIASTTIT